MSKKFVLILIAVLALTLGACTRAASSAPVATPTPAVNFPKPLATTGMNAIEVAGTQTALATSGLPMPLVGAGTEAAANPTFTPLAGVDQATALPSPTGEIAAANTPAPVVTAAPVTKPGSYTLKEGEFVYCIARRFNVNPDEILSLNGLADGQTFYPGLTLTMPSSGNPFPGGRALRAHPTQYTVAAGDSIYSIACKFGDLDPQSLASLSLTAGSTIQIP